MLLMEKEEIVSTFSQFPKEELLILRLYLSLCCQLLSGVKIHKDLKQISPNLYKDFLSENRSKIASFIPPANSSSSSDDDLSKPKSQIAKKPAKPAKNSEKPVKTPEKPLKIKQNRPKC